VKFCSHPNVSLKNHLSEVAVLSSKVQPVFVLKEASCLIGALHDFGKYTSFFQEHLESGGKVKNSQHSFISAVLTYFVLEKLYPDSKLPLLGFEVVLSHHSELADIKTFESLIHAEENPSLLGDFKNRVEVAHVQISDLRKKVKIIKTEFNEISKTIYKKVTNAANTNGYDAQLEKHVANLFNIPLSENSIFEKFSPERCAETIKRISLEEFFGEFDKILKRIAKDAYHLRLSEDIDTMNYYNYLYLLFSVLIDSDKRSAGKVKPKNRFDIPFNLVDKYESTKFKNAPNNQINKIRKTLYKEVNKQVDTINLETDRIFTITAPTGSGKTLTSLSFALKLRNRIKKEKGYLPRIIYSLPFVSIIEQNYDVFENVLSFGVKDFKKNESAYIVPHHHLAPIKFVEGEEKSIDEALMYIESWDSEIIVTTFVQFLYSVIAYKNRFLKKYHNIFGSIIILDEVQNIPIDYWDAVSKVLNDLAEKMNCYIILMTATKPLIFDNPRELFKENEFTFRQMNRVEFAVHLNGEKESDAYSRLLSEVKPDKSYLFVVNTIASSQALYNYIKEYADFPIAGCPNSAEQVGSARPLFYLSSLVVPKERRKRIETIKGFIKKGIKPILVSTQVVEAGVDLDFDVVYRDIAPVDSIVQAAGRCNREWKKEKGFVNVLEIKSEKNNQTLANYVYRKILPNITREILSNITSFEEPEVIDFVNKFFDKAKERAVDEEEFEKIKKALYKLQFSFLHEFTLIQDTGKESVFVAVDKEAEDFINRFIDKISSTKDFFERHRIFLQNRIEFALNTVSVPLKNLPPAEGDFYIVHNNQLDEYYDLETGYRKDVVNPIW
jgi:CRISPR-associated endonuclease/helicase Cas3